MTTTTTTTTTTTIISASAGTGKTYRLAHELKRELLEGDEPVAPERVVAVTFTRTAAAELAQRVRRALLEDGHVQLARRLAAARIGTIHSVCARLVREHAFELGLSPELKTLDEHLTLSAIQSAVEQQIPEDDRALLDELDVRMGGRGGSGLAWQSAVKELIDAARGNYIHPTELASHAERSARELASLLPPEGDAQQIESEALQVLEKVLAGQPPLNDQAKLEWDDLKEMRDTLKRGEALPWASWLTLSTSRWEALKDPGRAHLRHPRLRADLVGAIEVVFGVAMRALTRYDEEKRAWGVFDFVDQEAFALQLLQRPDVRGHLREQIGLVLVDEFQDTSPLQLAILSELATLAHKSVFVGDAKQAIFGFRGTDPQLMEAVVDAIATTNPEPLNVSWRSRPGLVELTSALFAPPFQQQGIHADHVKVTAALDAGDEPAGLGPFIERWCLRDGRSAAELAGGIAELLDDKSVMVRDVNRSTGRGGAAVPLEKRHIAVLARTNRHARDVAAELARIGIPAVLRRRGLCSTIEARALMAGLALFVDGGDALAAAELTRLTSGAGDADAWMKKLVEGERGKAFLDDAYVSEARKIAESNREAGVVLAVDLVVEKLRLRDACASWGDTPQRLANLGAVRALGVRYVEECFARGAGATVAGFLARLEELADSATDDLADEPDDEQGDVSGENAVNVVTWHKAKGREWPVVILSQLVYARPPRVFGVHVESDALRIDARRPLEQRWVRYWPTPYGEYEDSGGVIDLLDAHPSKAELDARALKEELRLLYVGWTRARDRLILPGPVLDETMASTSSRGGPHRLDMWAGPRSILRHLSHRGAPLVSEPALAPGASDLGSPGSGAVAGRARWAGVDVDVVIRRPRPRPQKEAEAGQRAMPAPLAAREWAPASLAPSSLAEVGAVAGDIVTMGAPIVLAYFADEDTMARLGNALHGFIAADPRVRARAAAAGAVVAHAADGGAGDDSVRFRLAERLLVNYRVRDLMQPSDLVLCADRLWRAIDERWPGARLRREAPVSERLAGGTVVRGIIDLVVDAGDVGAGGGGLVIIDHKTYAGVDPALLAPGFAGQLRAYAKALARATSRPTPATWVHLPLSAALVPVA